MDVQAYIASGILEQYAMGELSEQEMQQVDAMAREHPEVQAELQSIMQGLTQYARAHGQQPSGGLWDTIEQEISGDTGADAKPKANTTGYAGAKLAWLQPLAAAASILLLISLGLNLYFYFELDTTQQQLADLQLENSVLADQVQTASQQSQEAEAMIAFFNDPYTLDITLEAVTEEEDKTARVFWNEQSGLVYLNTKGLPDPPSGQQYQLWALKDGQPIDAGVASADATLAQAMKTITAADAFAITLEPEGGSSQPTLEALQVMGSLQG